MSLEHLHIAKSAGKLGTPKTPQLEMSDPSTSLLVRLGDAVRSPTGRLATVAVVSTAVTAASIFAGQALRRATKRHKLADSVREVVEDGDYSDSDELVDFTKPVGSRRSSMASVAQKSASKTARTGGAREAAAGKANGRKKAKTSEVIVREALARNYAFFGDEKMDAIRNKFVVVIGVGGVGSAAAVMLVRSGIRKIRIVDFDQVSLSSLNVSAVFEARNESRRLNPGLTLRALATAPLYRNARAGRHAQGHFVRRVLYAGRTLGRGRREDIALREGVGRRTARRRALPPTRSGPSGTDLPLRFLHPHRESRLCYRLYRQYRFQGRPPRLLLPAQHSRLLRPRCRSQG